MNLGPCYDFALASWFALFSFLASCKFTTPETKLFFPTPHRMKTTIGHHILPENYDWTPDKLQEMIRKIATRYPEETPYPRQLNLVPPNNPDQ
jgi:hypothetical protein